MELVQIVDVDQEIFRLESHFLRYSMIVVLSFSVWKSLELWRFCIEVIVCWILLKTLLLFHCGVIVLLLYHVYSTLVMVVIFCNQMFIHVL